MKARKITKIFVHYLKNNDSVKGRYHFVLNNDVMLNTMPLFSNSSIDNDSEALHFACVSYTDLPQKVTELSDKLGFIDAKIIELTNGDETEEKPKKKKNEKTVKL